MKIYKNNLGMGMIIFLISIILSGCLQVSEGSKEETDSSNKAASTLTFSQEETVTLKYFWSPYCIACKAEEPILQSFLKKHPGLNFIRIDVTKDNEEAKKYGIAGQTPGFVLIKGETTKITAGYLTKKELWGFICSKLEDEECEKFEQEN